MRATSWAVARSTVSHATGNDSRPTRTSPLVAPAVAPGAAPAASTVSTRTNVRHAAGSCSTEGATQTTCTPASAPRSTRRVRRERSTGASSSTSTTTVGSTGLGVSSPSSGSIGPRSSACVSRSAPRASTRSSSCDSSAWAAPGLSARWSPPSGLCGDPVCGSHSSHSQSARERCDVMAASTSFDGECRPASWTRIPRATASTADPAPATPSAPSVRRRATTGTPEIVAHWACSFSSSFQYSGSVLFSPGCSSWVRDGAAPSPMRTERNASCSGRCVHISPPSRRTASTVSPTDGASERRTARSTACVRSIVSRIATTPASNCSRCALSLRLAWTFWSR